MVLKICANYHQNMETDIEFRYGTLVNNMPALFKGLSSQRFIIEFFKYTGKLKGL